jgi:hypothetical protein
MMFYVDETDPTFLNSSMAQYCVRTGYAEFTRTCQQVDPQIFQTSVDIPVNNVQKYDLADPANNPCLMGPVLNPPTAKRFLRLIQLAYIWQANPLRLVKWEPVQDESQLIALTNTTWLNVAWIPGYYLLVGTELFFPCTIANATFRMFYQYDPWPVTPTSASWLDDLGQFSDLIALLAAKVYMSRDGTINKALTQNIMDRKSQLFEFLATGRDASGPNRVSILP